MNTIRKDKHLSQFQLSSLSADSSVMT